jgi:hypothetical protein
MVCAEIEIAVKRKIVAQNKNLFDVFMWKQIGSPSTKSQKMKWFHTRNLHLQNLCVIFHRS